MSLSCEKHTVYVVDRGGMDVIALLEPVGLVSWTRIRDDISEATVWIPSPGPECCKALGDLRTGRHEIAIYRGEKRVWEGPITRLTYRSDRVEIHARDVMHYASRTIARAAYNNAHPNVTTVTERAYNLLRNEMVRKERLTPPINVLPYVDVRTTDATARTSRSTKEYQSTVWEDIDSMAARAGLDYTVIGRRIILWSVNDPLGQTSTMTEQDFLSDVIITEYGMELCTYSAVTNGDGVWGAVGVGPVGSESIDPYYGEWELLHTAYDENSTPTTVGEPPTTTELRSQAQRNMSGRNPAPAIVRVPDNSSINPMTTVLDIDDLCPGVWIPVRSTSTCRQVLQVQKLDRVAVEESPDGEKISVTMSPVSAALAAFSTAGSDDGV